MKRTPLKRRSTTPRAKLKRKADALWSQAIRSAGACAKCGATDKQLHAHHLIGRRVLATRWRLENGICLCAGCHVYALDSAHINPVAFLAWLDNARPDQHLWARRHRHDRGKVDVQAAVDFLSEIVDSNSQKT